MKLKIFKNFILILFCISIFPGCFVNASSDPASPWDMFLKQPNKESLLILQDAISGSSQRCSWGNAHNLSVVPTEKGKQLFKLMADGNEYAFDASIMVIRCFDGGELEDFYRSSGAFFEQHPKTFLRIVEEKTVPDSDIKHMLTSLPLDTVDNIAEKIRVVDNRITLLTPIGEESVGTIKAKCLSFLKNEKDTLSNIHNSSTR